MSIPLFPKKDNPKKNPLKSPALKNAQLTDPTLIKLVESIDALFDKIVPLQALPPHLQTELQGSSLSQPAVQAPPISHNPSSESQLASLQHEQSNDAGASPLQDLGEKEAIQQEPTSQAYGSVSDATEPPVTSSSPLISPSENQESLTPEQIEASLGQDSSPQAVADQDPGIRSPGKNSIAGNSNDPQILMPAIEMVENISSAYPANAANLKDPEAIEEAVLKGVPSDTKKQYILLKEKCPKAFMKLVLLTQAAIAQQNATKERIREEDSYSLPHVKDPTNARVPGPIAARG